MHVIEKSSQLSRASEVISPGGEPTANYQFTKPTQSLITIHKHLSLNSQIYVVFIPYQENSLQQKPLEKSKSNKSTEL